MQIFKVTRRTVSTMQSFTFKFSHRNWSRRPTINFQNIICMSLHRPYHPKSSPTSKTHVSIANSKKKGEEKATICKLLCRNCFYLSSVLTLSSISQVQFKPLFSREKKKRNKTGRAQDFTISEEHNSKTAGIRLVYYPHTHVHR